MDAPQLQMRVWAKERRRVIQSEAEREVLKTSKSNNVRSKGGPRETRPWVSRNSFIPSAGGCAGHGGYSAPRGEETCKHWLAQTEH